MAVDARNFGWAKIVDGRMGILVSEASMQTVRYYRDYAERARKLTESVDRRGIRETLETLAAGFEEIARALETGMVSPVHPQENPNACRHCQRDAPRHAEGPARFLSTTRH
jgi:hypothetical protein